MSMQEHRQCFTNLEWPPAGARVRGPVLWLRGWLVAKPGHHFTDVRAVTAGRTHLGVLGLPRSDLPAHFGGTSSWLPGEYVIGLPVVDGSIQLTVEARDLDRTWQPVATMAVTIAPDGLSLPSIEGELPGGGLDTHVERGPHLPLHGYLDDPEGAVMAEHERIQVFGWLLHERQTIRRVFATNDLLVFNHLAHGVTDDALATKVPQLPAARHARLHGEVDAPPPNESACLRVYAELDDGSVHLCFARRFTRKSAANEPPALPIRLPGPATAVLLPRPSGRPRRMAMFVRSLREADATRRALDLACHLATARNWVVRVIAAADGPYRDIFEHAGVPVQIVNPKPLLQARGPEAIQIAIDDLGRQLWLRHLDVVVIFDPVCCWAAPLARRAAVPVILDHVAVGRLNLPAHLADTVASCDAFVFGTAEAAAANAMTTGAKSISVVGPWHRINLPQPAPRETHGRRYLVAPIRGTAAAGAPLLLRAIAHLHRTDAAVARHYRYAITEVREEPAELRFADDCATNLPEHMAIERIPLEAATACVAPSVDDLPIHHLLDAAATGIPLIVADSPATRELFHHETAFFAPGSAVALAGAVAEFHANEAAARERASRLKTTIRQQHDPTRQMIQWQQVIESVVATHRLDGSLHPPKPTA